jgi:hypothetical protein
MTFSTYLRKALPYVVAVVVFWCVSAIYFAPQFSGDTISMNDVIQYGGGKADISAHRAATGEDPQWTGGMFGGMPAYLISVNYPAMILRNGVQWLLGFVGEPMSLMFLAMVGFWIMLLMCRVNPWLAIPFALAYGLSTYNILIIEAGHVTKMRAMGYAPMLVGAVWWTFRRGAWIGGALAALFGTLLIAAAHPQITYYFLLVVLALWINEFVCTIRDKGWGADVIKPGEEPRHRTKGQIGKFSPFGSVKLFSIRKGWGQFWLATGVLAAAAILAVGANFTHIWYTFEHSPETTRGGSEIAAATAEGSDGSGGLDLEYATAWSYGTGESFNMFVPNLQGGGTWTGFAPDGEVAQVLRESGISPSAAAQLPTYWGTQPGTGGPTYLGAVVLFLFVLGMFVLPARTKWWILGMSVFALFLAWGRNAMWFTQLAFELLPGYNKFRTVAMALAVLQWSVPFVAALVASEIWRGEFSEGADKAQFMTGLAWSAGITGGLALVFAVAGGAFFNFAAPSDAYYEDVVGLGEAMRSERAAMLSADAWRSFVFVALTATLVWAWVSKRDWKRWIPVAGLSALTLIDLVGVDLRYLSHDDFHAPAQVKVTPDEADLAIMEDTEPGYRVLNDANPFNEARTSYFHRSIGGYHAAKLQRYQDIIDRYLSRFHIGVINMLNTKYYIENDPASGERTVAINPEAFGAAWFVGGVQWVDGAMAELDALETADLRRIAVVDERFRERVPTDFPADDAAEIELTEYRPNYLKYETSATSEQLAVFSEIYYDKGWKAYIDGEEMPYLRADYILRAMEIPAGEHVVEWRFRAPRFATVEGVTLAASIAVLLWLAVAIFLERRKKANGNG